MKVYLECPPQLGQGIHRVVRELKAHLPLGVEAIQDRTAADLILHHVVGVQNFSEAPIHELIEQDAKPYGILQYCVRTTERPGTEWWHHMVWEQAQVVWSYYDLFRLMQEDSWTTPPATWSGFYHAPLGVSEAFHMVVPPATPGFLVGTSGYIAETEGVDVWMDVARQRGKATFHLGPPLPCITDLRTFVINGIADTELATMWSQCQFVNGLRVVEGFELPAAEGLVCGARPVLFSRPDHHEWFGHHALYLPEGLSFEENVRTLKALVKVWENSPVTATERAWARHQFSWPRILGGFWEVLGYGPQSPR